MNLYKQHESNDVKKSSISRELLTVPDSILCEPTLISQAREKYTQHSYSL